MALRDPLRKLKRRLYRPVEAALERRTRTRVLTPDEVPFMKPSFSQCGEDLIVRHLFDVLNVATPSYLDVGAHHPFEISNTALFHLAGSRGINIEPDPSLFAEFVERRPTAVNLNIGIAAEPGRLTFYRMSAPGLSTFSAEAAAQARQETAGRVTVVEESLVPVMPVAAVLREHFEGGCPDFLSLDVEGLDLAILRTMPDWPGCPLVVCVETATFSETGGSRKIPEIGRLMAELGYDQYADTWVNTIYVRHGAADGR